jgi:hypothetical protein
VIGALLSGDGEDGDQAKVGTTATPTNPPSSRTATPATSLIPPTTAAATPAPPRVITVVVEVPAPTPTPVRRPAAIQVRSVSPPIGNLSTEGSFTVSVDVDYQAGDASNVLGWTLSYCFAATDCNTYSLPTAYAIVPGSSGSATLSALFSPGADGLRPVALCRMTVVIGHFLTPESQWQSERSPDSRCYDVFEQEPAVKVLDVQPALGTRLSSGESVAVNVEYDAGPANTLRVMYHTGTRCWSGAEGAATVAVERGTHGVTTVLIPIDAAATGHPLFYVKAQLLNDSTLLREYGFGPC